MIGRLGMQQVLAMTYLWLKAGHMIFVIFWMAGLFMLPRYFVYHQEAAPGFARERELWIDREAQAAQDHPVAFAGGGLGAGPGTGLEPGFLPKGWFHAKLALVLGLSGITSGWRAMPGRWRGASAG
jgi:putative membrane protein